VQKRTNPLNNQKGMALVLAISMIALLASMGVWLMIESHSGTRITRAFERMEETFHLAEGGCWLSVHALDTLNMGTSDCATVSSNLPAAPPSYLNPRQQVTDPNDSQKYGYVTPEIFAARDMYSLTLPPGWGMNSEDGTGGKFFRAFYLVIGTGEVPMPQSKGRARSVLYNLSEKVTRNSSN